jgi:hypothetical protein
MNLSQVTPLGDLHSKMVSFFLKKIRNQKNVYKRYFDFLDEAEYKREAEDKADELKRTLQLKVSF